MKILLKIVLSWVNMIHIHLDFLYLPAVYLFPNKRFRDNDSWEFRNLNTLGSEEV